MAFIHAERPAGYKSNNPGAANDARLRVGHARKAMGLANSEAFHMSNGEYAFQPDGGYDFTKGNTSGSIGTSTYDEQSKLGYSPSNMADRYSDSMRRISPGDYDTLGATNSDVVRSMNQAAKSFADGVVRGQSNPFDYSNSFGAF